MAGGRVQDDLLIDTDERRQLRESVAKLVGRYGRGYFQEVTRKGEKPDALWTEMGQAGYLGVHLPEEWGGGGGGLVDLAIVIEETSAQGCPMFMLVISPAIAGSLLAAHGSEEQKREWLPGIAAGTKKIAFAITEPDAGTNTHNISTTAHADGDGWRIRGQKYWTSGIDEADAVIVVCRGVEPGPNGRHPISMFLVPTGTPGLSFQKIDSALQIPENQFTTFFDDVPVTEENLVGVEGAGLKQVFAGLNPERVTAASQANGIARYALSRAARYAAERTVWSTPIGAHQGVSHPLAKAFVDVQLARLMTMHAAELTDAGADAGSASTIAKYAAGEAVVQALDQAIQVHGGNGLSNEYGLSDLWFTARMFRTAPVSREMVLNHVAQHNLGLPKSY
ncbi:acyl-CoA dehydrogenase family protein [Pseudonocardia sp. RS010]|uniref:acyl-CoA dehydrogenase family protein n=1 Tax=Pseudonocardia sp. RS010 TaxID=3385979 RepID=UPI0039A01A3D